MSDIERQIAALSPAKQALLRARLERRERENRLGRVIPLRPAGCKPPLSFSQERVWLHQQLVPGSVVYNRPANLRLRGQLKVEALRRALREMVARHESLRTIVQWEGSSPSLSVQPKMDLEIPLMDLSSEPSPEQLAREVAYEQARQPFILEHGPLLRCHLIRLDREDHLLLLTFHHFTFDAWSQAVLLEELTSHYQAYATGTQPSVESLEIQFPDFAHWDRSTPRVSDEFKVDLTLRRIFENPTISELAIEVQKLPAGELNSP